MKLLKHLFVSYLAIFPLLLNAQSPTRSVIYTLKKNEKLKSSEYYISQKLEKNKFAIIITDTILKKESFVFNGKVIFSNTSISSEQSGSNVLIDFDLDRPNGYTFKYEKDGKWYVNYEGKIEGPFERVLNERFEMIDNISWLKQLSGTFSQEYAKIPKSFDFCYQLGDDWYSYNKGQIEKIEKADLPDWLTPSYGSWTSAITNGEKRSYTDINGIKLKTPLDTDSSLICSETLGENVACIFLRNGKKYFYYNGTISEPFDKNGEYNGIELTENGYIYSFSKDNKNYLNFNGAIVPIFDGSSSWDAWAGFVGTNGGTYYTYKKDKKNYITINGKTYGPYDSFLYNSFIIHENGKFAFVFGNGKKYYANINSVVSEGQSTIFAFSYFPDGKYEYSFCQKDGWVYKNQNGTIVKTANRKTYSPYSGTEIGNRYFNESIDKYEIKSSNNKHNLTTNIEYNYVVIDGRSYGKAAAISAWYDEALNSFIWNAWEENELVMYEFKLN